jgi:hypothetical protein
METQDALLHHILDAAADIKDNNEVMIPVTQSIHT